jgi:hypothetical protein
MEEWGKLLGDSAAVLYRWQSRTISPRTAFSAWPVLH